MAEKEYIEREALIKRLEVTPILKHGIPAQVRDGVIDLVEKQPAADVAPVRHGRWGVTQVNGVDAIFACSECSREVKAANDYFGKPTEHIAKIYPYCHCGAKMDSKGGGNT